jgi:hypothetical protein
MFQIPGSTTRQSRVVEANFAWKTPGFLIGLGHAGRLHDQQRIPILLNLGAQRLCQNANSNADITLGMMKQYIYRFAVLYRRGGCP